MSDTLMGNYAGSETLRMNDEVKAEITSQSSEGEIENVENAEQSGDLSDNRDNLNVKSLDDGQFEQVNDQDEERQKSERDRTPCRQECDEFSVELCRHDTINHQTIGEESVEEVALITDDKEEEEHIREKSEQDHSDYYALKRESSVQLDDAEELKLFLIGLLLGST